MSPLIIGRIQRDPGSVNASQDTADISKVKLSTPFLVQVVALIITWVVGGLLTYSAMSSRIAVVESRQSESDRRQGDTDRRMERMESKLDRILERLK